MSPEQALICAVMVAVTIVIFGLVHKWQSQDFRRGYGVALNHVEFDLSRQYVNTVQPTVRLALKDSLDIVRKLRKENDHG